jgi:hypothetical protein
VVVVAVVEPLPRDWGVPVWATRGVPSSRLVVGVVVVVLMRGGGGGSGSMATFGRLSRFDHVRTYAALMPCTFVNLVVPSTKYL